MAGANLQEARLQKAIFEESKMNETNQIAADLKYSNLKYCKFHAAQMQSAHFHSAELIGAEFNKADIAGAYFWNLETTCIAPLALLSPGTSGDSFEQVYKKIIELKFSLLIKAS